MLLGWLALARLLRGTRAVTDASLLCLLDELRKELRCGRRIEVRETTVAGRCGSPAVVGWRRPLMLLPADWRLWSLEVRRGILAHETAHVAHGDFLKWLAAQAGVVLNFYNPLVQWLAGRLRLEQELAADARGAALAGGAKAYAAVLAKIALRQDESRTLWAGCPFFPTRGTLMRRIEMLQKQRSIGDRSPSRTWLTVMLATLVLVGLAVSGLRGPSGAARANDPSPDNPSASAASPNLIDGTLPTFDGSFLPSETIAVMSIKPLSVPGSNVVIEPTLSSFPMSFGYGFAAREPDKVREWEVEEVRTIVLSAPDKALSSESPDSKEPSLMESYRLRRPYDKSKLRVKLFGEAPDGATELKSHGCDCFRAASDVSGQFVNYFLVDDRTFVIMRERDVARVLAVDPGRHPSWYGRWQKMCSSPMAVAFDAAAVAALEEREPDSTEDVFWSAVKETDHLFARLDATADALEASATALCKSADQAATMQSAKRILAMAGTALPQLLQPSSLSEEYQAIDLRGPLVKSLEQLQINVQDHEVHVAAKFDAAFVAKLAEATQALMNRQGKEHEQRQKEDEPKHIAKLRRLAEAMNAYHAEHGHYPSAAVAGPDGKTPHSWRVELLPYLGEEKLFAEYKLDEPWDSEHNKQLVAKIPEIYSTSGFSIHAKQGFADYYVVTGKGTLFDAGPVNRESILDAPGETILVMQSLQRVPWTKPVDIETLADHEPVVQIRCQEKGFYAAFADGTVKLVPNATDAASVRAMFTKAGGDTVKLR